MFASVRSKARTCAGPTEAARAWASSSKRLASSPPGRPAALLVFGGLAWSRGAASGVFPPCGSWCSRCWPPRWPWPRARGGRAGRGRAAEGRACRSVDASQPCASGSTKDEGLGRHFVDPTLTGRSTVLTNDTAEDGSCPFVTKRRQRCSRLAVFRLIFERADGPEPAGTRLAVFTSVTRFEVAVRKLSRKRRFQNEV